MSKRFVVAVLLLLSIGLLAGVHGQSSTAGNITGTVRDQQGAAVAKAEITIQDEKTGGSRTVTTNDDGFYNAPSVPPRSLHVDDISSGIQEDGSGRDRGAR